MVFLPFGHLDLTAVCFFHTAFHPVEIKKYLWLFATSFYADGSQLKLEKPLCLFCFLLCEFQKKGVCNKMYFKQNCTPASDTIKRNVPIMLSVGNMLSASRSTRL